MDLFPEFFAGNAGMSAVQFACGLMDQSGGATTQVAELFNPALTGTAQNAVGNVPLVTLTGFIVSVATANADLKICTTATAALVNGAPTAGPQWMDSRRTDSPTATWKIGQVAAPSGLITTLPLVFNTSPLWIPWNWDLSAGSGLVFSIAGANRAVLTAIWIERPITS